MRTDTVRAGRQRQFILVCAIYYYKNLIRCQWWFVAISMSHSTQYSISILINRPPLFIRCFIWIAQYIGTSAKNSNTFNRERFLFLLSLISMSYVHWPRVLLLVSRMCYLNRFGLYTWRNLWIALSISDTQKKNSWKMILPTNMRYKLLTRIHHPHFDNPLMFFFHYSLFFSYA